MHDILLTLVTVVPLLFDLDSELVAYLYVNWNNGILN